MNITAYLTASTNPYVTRARHRFGTPLELLILPLVTPNDADSIGW